MAKTVSNPTPNVGDTVTFTIKVSNSGPNTATNVSVSDLLPAGLTFVSATPSQGVYNSVTGVWTVGTVTVGATPTLLFRARVASPQAQTNTAAISSADQFDPNTANDMASATETPQQADLAVAKAVSNPTPNVGDTINYIITLTNLGINAATNVTLQDLLPAGLTFVSAVPSQGSYNPTSGIWTVGTATATTAETLLLVRARREHACRQPTPPPSNMPTSSIRTLATIRRVSSRRPSRPTFSCPRLWMSPGPSSATRSPSP